MTTIKKTILLIVLLMTTITLSAQVENYLDKALQGDAESMYQLAMCYRRGHGVKADNTEAMLWLKKAAEKGHTAAQYYLGTYYEYGDGGLGVDSMMAYKYFTLAAEKKDVYSMLELGQNFRNLTTIKDAKSICMKWLEKVSEGDFVSEYDRFNDMHKSTAELELYYLYLGNEGVEKNIPLAMEYLKKSVSYPDNCSLVIAMNEMGICYMEGQGVNKNKEEAVKWFKRAAKQNYGIAIGNLAEIYYNDEQYDEAFRLLKDVCEDDLQIWPSAKAMRLLSYCYTYGRGTQKNNELGDYWWNEAAKHKDKTILEYLRSKDN